MVLGFRLHPELLLGSQPTVAAPDRRPAFPMQGIPLSPPLNCALKSIWARVKDTSELEALPLGLWDPLLGSPLLCTLHWVDTGIGRGVTAESQLLGEPWTEIWVWAYHTGTVEKLRLDSALGQKSGWGTPTSELMDPECWGSRPPPAPVSWAHGLTPAGLTPGEFYEQTRLFSTGIIIFVI